MHPRRRTWLHLEGADLCIYRSRVHVEDGPNASRDLLALEDGLVHLETDLCITEDRDTASRDGLARRMNFFSVCWQPIAAHWLTLNA
ncbi:hypothetical protein AVEN_91184-1 [Araneus ventricosus]|uniref:Uncharacterized protein n=1 Tax=Araneus ventricosus TaxID=182803 RepID=A0A4Y2KV87_ARAVE|nr:hypothetical protein AVEN_91184-1 [Araneus ventricosus]